MAKKTVVVELTSAVAFDGKVSKAGELLEVTEKEARNLLRRGKAVLSDEQPAESELSDLTVAELRELADDAGIEGAASMKKADLIAAIEAVEDGE